MPEIDLDLLTDFEKNLPHHYMVFVEGGEFDMGGRDEEAEDDEKPVHRVKVNSFYLAKYPVTQALWMKVMGNNPSIFQGDDRPVEYVSWEDCQVFLEKLNSLTKRNYRLPSEAEWEFAARGGIYSEGYLYAGSDKLKEVGWYDGNSGRESHPVGQKLDNELRLHDMSGNVYEWVKDQYHEDYCDAPYDGSERCDSENRTDRVLRGGGWINNSRYCRVSSRGHTHLGDRNDAVGFRLALS